MTWILKQQMPRSEPNIKEYRAPFLFVVRQRDSLLDEGSVLDILF